MHLANGVGDVLSGQSACKKDGLAQTLGFTSQFWFTK
jgi:hypothetical protein